MHKEFPPRVSVHLFKDDHNKRNLSQHEGAAQRRFFLSSRGCSDPAAQQGDPGGVTDAQRQGHSPLRNSGVLLRPRQLLRLPETAGAAQAERGRCDGGPAHASGLERSHLSP